MAGVIERGDLLREVDGFPHWHHEDRCPEADRRCVRCDVGQSDERLEETWLVRMRLTYVARRGDVVVPPYGVVAEPLRRLADPHDIFQVREREGHAEALLASRDGDREIHEASARIPRARAASGRAGPAARRPRT